MSLQMVFIGGNDLNVIFFWKNCPVELFEKLVLPFLTGLCLV